MTKKPLDDKKLIRQGAEEILEEALAGKHPDLTTDDLEAFEHFAGKADRNKRKWTETLGLDEGEPDKSSPFKK